MTVVGNLDAGPVHNVAEMGAHGLICDGLILDIGTVGRGCREGQFDGNDLRRGV